MSRTVAPEAPQAYALRLGRSEAPQAYALRLGRSASLHLHEFDFEDERRISADLFAAAALAVG